MLCVCHVFSGYVANGMPPGDYVDTSMMTSRSMTSLPAGVGGAKCQQPMGAQFSQQVRVVYLYNNNNNKSREILVRLRISSRESHWRSNVTIQRHLLGPHRIGLVPLQPALFLTFVFNPRDLYYLKKNNNNNLIYIAPACRMTSEALRPNY